MEHPVAPVFPCPRVSWDFFLFPEPARHRSVCGAPVCLQRHVHLVARRPQMMHHPVRFVHVKHRCVFLLELFVQLAFRVPRVIRTGRYPGFRRRLDVEEEREIHGGYFRCEFLRLVQIRGEPVDQELHVPPSAVHFHRVTQQPQREVRTEHPFVSSQNFVPPVENRHAFGFVFHELACQHRGGKMDESVLRGQTSAVPLHSVPVRTER
mmetsp:Transcript_13005/g.48650  ORF Transcript_13005/g.48650 Transcript_13005/m.48650 type:complete len:208 (+) Transcript_13005:2149-2772(+)